VAVITRRQLTAALGGAAMALPLGARAQQPAMPVIGFLHSTTATGFLDDRLSAFRQGLKDVGFVEGRNVAIEFRFANGQRSQLPKLATDLVDRGVAAIVVNGVSLSAAMASTSTIPIVFVSGTDPVIQGAVSSINRPGGNVTGVSSNRPGLNPKRLQLLHELLPKPAIIAVLLDPNGPAFEIQLQNVSAAARTLGRQIVVVKAASEAEFETAFTTIRQASAGGFFVGTSAFFADQRRKLVAFAADHALPASYDAREFVDLGGLMSYGPSAVDAYLRGGAYVGRILKGAKPTDLPVELPRLVELVINLATAKALGLGVPRHLLVQAAHVIH
jgi:putative tryptophan/tyrosine transport system substrate-binding protein